MSSGTWRATRDTAVVMGAAMLTVALLTWPLLADRGYPLAKDMVFTPDLPLSPQAVGLTSDAPRAVPLDAVVAILDSVTGGEILSRLAVVGGLCLAALAAGRAARHLPLLPRVLCTVLAVWNPFVIERLALGQWALLLGYAGLWGCVAQALTTWRLSGGCGRAVGPWIGLGALTPTGGLLTGVAAVVMLWRDPDRWIVRAMALVAQLPWVIPGLLSSAGAFSDPEGVAAFAARSERPGGVLWTLLGLGGVWDRLSVPGSRAGLYGHLTSAVIVLSILTVMVHAVRSRDRWPHTMPLALLGLAGLALASISSFPLGARGLAWMIETVPGTGLLRDSQKWLAWFVVPAVLAVAKTSDLLLGWTSRRLQVLSTTVAAVTLVLPIVLVPDGTPVVWRTLAPVAYPTDFDRVARLVDGAPGSLVTTPWRSYREFSWSHGRPVYDPASRWFDIDVVGSGSLLVGDIAVEGENPRAEAVGQVLQESPGRWAGGLAALGISHVLVYADDADRARYVPGADLVFRGDFLELWRLREKPNLAPDSSPTAYALLVALDVLIAGFLLLGGSRLVRGAWQSLPGRLVSK